MATTQAGRDFLVPRRTDPQSERRDAAGTAAMRRRAIDDESPSTRPDAKLKWLYHRGRRDEETGLAGFVSETDMGDEDRVIFLQWALPRLRLRWEGFRKVRRQVGKRLVRRLETLGLPEGGMFAQDYDRREICRKVTEDRPDVESVPVARDVRTERLEGPRAATARMRTG